jgi:hypothetical protein
MTKFTVVQAGAHENGPVLHVPDKRNLWKREKATGQWLFPFSRWRFSTPGQFFTWAALFTDCEDALRSFPGSREA